MQVWSKPQNGLLTDIRNEAHGMRLVFAFKDGGPVLTR
jgi:hypothetical protein